MPSKEYNETSEDQYHKFTINIPKKMYSKIHARKDVLEFKHLCDYFMYLAEVDCRYFILKPPTRYIPQTLMTGKKYGK